MEGGTTQKLMCLVTDKLKSWKLLSFLPAYSLLMFFYYFTEKEEIRLLVSGVQLNVHISLCSLLICHKNDRKGICYQKNPQTKKTQKPKMGGKALPYKDKEHGKGQRKQMENR